MEALQIVIVFTYVFGTIAVVLYAIARMFGFGQGRHQH
jgi:hypothetical protein